MSAVLLAVALGLLSSSVNAYILQSCQEKNLKNKVCTGQPDGAAVCWMCPDGKDYPVGTSYIVCNKGNGTIARCPKGYIFDYEKRICLHNRDPELLPCFHMDCPMTLGFKGMSPVYGTFGRPGSWSWKLPSKASSITVFSPVPGQCQMGMIMTVTTRGFPPKTLKPPYKNQNITVQWKAPLNNSYGGWAMLPEYKGYANDIVNFVWDEPNHLLAYWNNQNRTLPADRVPFPPQPVYKCPEFQPFTAGSSAQKTFPGETIIAPIDFNGNVTYTLVTPGTFFVADPMPGSCRQGMVFKLNVDSSYVGYSPKTIVIRWMQQTWDNFPDMRATVGDRLRFEWAQPVAGTISAPPHGVSLLQPYLVGTFLNETAMGGNHTGGNSTAGSGRRSRRYFARRSLAQRLMQLF